MDDANAMTRRIPGDERSFCLEQGNLSEYAGKLRTSLIELFKDRIHSRFSGIYEDFLPPHAYANR